MNVKVVVLSALLIVAVVFVACDTKKGTEGGVKTIAWTDKTPPEYKRDVFQPLLEKTLADAGLSVRLVGFDCKEPPCIAMMHNYEKTGKSTGLAGSTLWKSESRSIVLSGYSDLVDCGDGRKERVELLSPHKVLPARTDEEKNRSRRLRARWDEIMKNWKGEPAS